MEAEEKVVDSPSKGDPNFYKQFYLDYIKSPTHVIENRELEDNEKARPHKKIKHEYEYRYYPDLESKYHASNEVGIDLTEDSADEDPTFSPPASPPQIERQDAEISRLPNKNNYSPTHVIENRELEDNEKARPHKKIKHEYEYRYYPDLESKYHASNEVCIDLTEDSADEDPTFSPPASPEDAAISRPPNKNNYRQGTRESYHGLPIYEKGRKNKYSADEIIEILLETHVDHSVLCEQVPSRVQRNMSFLVNLDKLVDERDLLADDNGAYQSNSERPSYITMEDDGITKYNSRPIARLEESSHGCEKYILRKLHSTLTNVPGFHRVVYRLQNGHSGVLPTNGSKYYPYCLVQYFFDRIEHDFDVAPHGNSKRVVPFKQTCHSLRGKIGQFVQNDKPAQARQKLLESMGGLLAATSSATVPRNSKQIRNYRARTASSQRAAFSGGKDELGAVMETCKTTINKPDKCFVHRVNGAPEPMMVVGTDKSFRDLERFCCVAPRPRNSVLTVDPTFNLGDFYFSPTTYEHLGIINRNTGKSPLFIGPSLIHYQKHFSTYHYFASSIVNINPNCALLKCFGTDGEENLSNAFSSVFRGADHLRCEIHSRRNVKDKLSELNMQAQKKDLYLRDIYGYTIGNVYHEGLVDAEDSAAFDGQLASLQQEWDSREESGDPKFFFWFSENIATYMQINMLTPERCRNGVTGKFTTNRSESINAMIKRKVQYNAQDLLTFVSCIEELFQKQEEIVRSAFVGEGDYELVPDAKAFFLGEKYFQIPTRQKLLHEQRYYSSKLLVDIHSHPSLSNEQVVQVDATTTSCDEDQHDDLDDLCSLEGITVEHSKRIVIKAKRLMGRISKGADPGTFFVPDTDSKIPHFIQKKSPGVYTCDKEERVHGCASFKARNLCSHVVAVSMLEADFDLLVVKFNQSGHKELNLTTLAHHGIRPGAGKKGPNVRKRARKDPLEIVERVPLVDQSMPQGIKMKIARNQANTYQVQNVSDSQSITDEPFYLCSLKQHPKVRTCAGCHRQFARGASGKPPNAPHDIILQHQEKPVWLDRATNLLRTGRRQAVYYHISDTCVRRGGDGGNADFSARSVDLSRVDFVLTDEHKRYLLSQIGFRA